MFFKYIFDRVVAALGLLLLWPLLILVTILIRIKMPGGPALFKQKRVGRHGHLFTMVKFRTMTIGHCGSSVSMAGESRITPIGSILRKYKIDELPELWNVLKGDMSFVGPRPDVPGYADKLVGENRRVLELRPGITAPASLKYRDEEELIATYVHKMNNKGLRIKNGIPEEMTDEDIAILYNDTVIYPDKVRLNLYYLDHYSFWRDIQMIFCTVLGKQMSYGGETI